MAIAVERFAVRRAAKTAGQDRRLAPAAGPRRLAAMKPWVTRTPKAARVVAVNGRQRNFVPGGTKFGAGLAAGPGAGRTRWFGRLMAGLLAAAASGFAEEPSGDRSLPPPNLAGGRLLVQALADRRTTRDFKPDSLADQHLSDLLWAAFGINRPAEGRRTAPSAKNAQEIDVYVALAGGLYLYEARPHRLKHQSGADLRSLTSGQDFARVAPVALVLVADFGRFPDTTEEQARLYAAFDAGAIAQNVSLYCASVGLGTVVHELNREPLARALNLGKGQHIIMAQAVGWPK